MSTLIVPITKIEAVEPHPNADRLEIAKILGWQVIVGKGTYNPGDEVIYVQPDSVVPQEWSDRWGVTQYLSKGRVRSIRLRGEPSFGFTAPREDAPPSARPGDNVAEHFGIVKYAPPARKTSGVPGDSRPDDPRFSRYTDIENLRHFPDIFEDGEEVVVAEKVHGTNSRVGLVGGEWMAGSHRVQRRRPGSGRLDWVYRIPGAERVLAAFGIKREVIGPRNPGASLYWQPLENPSVLALLEDVASEGHKQVILYGEIFGAGVQKLTYGRDASTDYLAFDLLADGRYLDHDEFAVLCSQHGVSTAPVLYRGPYDLDAIRPLAEGETTLGGGHIREGVVVRPVRERRHPKVGRLILKYVGDGYLTGKAAEEELADAA
jgi:RNA ligase (TIGR02306 family)